MDIYIYKSERYKGRVQWNIETCCNNNLPSLKFEALEFKVEKF